MTAALFVLHQRGQHPVEDLWVSHPHAGTAWAAFGFYARQAHAGLLGLYAADPVQPATDVALRQRQMVRLCVRLALGKSCNALVARHHVVDHGVFTVVRFVWVKYNFLFKSSSRGGLV